MSAADPSLSAPLNPPASPPAPIAVPLSPGAGEDPGQRGSIAGAISLTITRPLTGLTRIERTGFQIMLLVKFVASVIVIISGSGAVVRSGNDFDLIVNSLAAVFIVDIPALAYKVCGAVIRFFMPPRWDRRMSHSPNTTALRPRTQVFLPPAFKRLIQDMPPFSNPAREEAKKCTCKSLINRCSSAIAAKVRIAFVALYIYIYFALCVCISYLLVQAPCFRYTPSHRCRCTRAMTVRRVWPHPRRSDGVEAGTAARGGWLGCAREPTGAGSTTWPKMPAIMPVYWATATCACSPRHQRRRRLHRDVAAMDSPRRNAM